MSISQEALNLCVGGIADGRRINARSAQYVVMKQPNIPLFVSDGPASSMEPVEVDRQTYTLRMWRSGEESRYLYVPASMTDIEAFDMLLAGYRGGK